MNDEDYMRLALKEAEKATSEGNWPIGCVIVLDGKVVASAHNLIYSTKNRLAHAELLALKDAQEYIFDRPREAVLYSNYEPCPMCFGACVNGRLKKVVYGVDLNESGAVHLIEHLPALYKTDDYKTEFVGGVLAEECSMVYRAGEAEVLRRREQSAKR